MTQKFSRYVVIHFIVYQMRSPLANSYNKLHQPQILLKALDTSGNNFFFCFYFNKQHVLVWQLAKNGA